MTQQHRDRLTAVDASFLHNEGANSHMHVGGVMIFEGPPPAYADFAEQIRSRLHLVPRYRQRLAAPRLEAGRPLWVDDTSFHLDYHLRHTALPAPGSEQQLRALAARVFSQQLDRAKPLWECWLVQGLAPARDGGPHRFALISKTHHALIDGIAGVDLSTVLLDLTPVPPESSAPGGEPWSAQRTPGDLELVAGGIGDALRAPAGLLRGALGAARSPQRTVHAVREVAEGLGEVVWAGMHPAPETPLNVPIGPYRRYAWTRNRLAELKEVKDAFGGTVNDVVLAVVAGALRDWLRAHGTRTEGLELRALVPVSIRAADQHGAGGNQIAAMRGPLPVYVDDPVARLQVVRTAMDGLKESKQAVGAEALSNVQNLAPPTVLAQAARANFSTRLFNLIVTNVPGPQFPLYMLGRELLDLFPIAFLPEGHGLAIAIMSYDGGVRFGLLADYDAIPDVQDIADGIDAAIGELLAVVRRDGEAAPEGSGPGSGSAADADRHVTM